MMQIYDYIAKTEFAYIFRDISYQWFSQERESRVWSDRLLTGIAAFQNPQRESLPS